MYHKSKASPTQSQVSKAPWTHLTPWQDITYECSCSHQDVNQRPDYPQLTTWRSIRTIIQSSTNMKINPNEKERSTISMKESQHPSIINISSNMLQTIKGLFNIRVIMHGLLHSCYYHLYLILTKLRTKTPKITQVTCSWTINLKILKPLAVVIKAPGPVTGKKVNR